MVRKKQVIIGGICVIGVLSVGILAITKIKYKEADSVNIANSTVNYDAIKNNMVAMYKSEDGENYTEITDRMPDSGYIINEEKSYCNLSGVKDDNAILKTVNGNHTIANLIKGDKCYLYFDKVQPITVDNIIADLNVNTTTPTFSSVAKTDEGVFKVEDGMYGGTSYYWRGAVTDNYVKFANLCWRIVRINGDGTMRLIYDGESCHANGTTGEVAVASQEYNVNSNRSEYAGYSYVTSLQRTLSGTSSNLKTQTESWYTTNIADNGFDDKVVNGKFCNDRNTASGYSWSTQPSSTFYYAGYDRSGAKSATSVTPKLSCSNSSDIYDLKVGAITMDEIIMAGGKWNITNSNYYLCNGNLYWTMTPYYWYYGSTSNRGANVFGVNASGQLTYGVVNNTAPGVRPVINLLSDTEFKSGTDGSLNNPYEVI